MFLALLSVRLLCFHGNDEKVKRRSLATFKKWIFTPPRNYTFYYFVPRNQFCSPQDIQDTGWNHKRELWYIGGTNTDAVVTQWMEGRQTCDMVWSILEGYLLLLSELNKNPSWLTEWGSGGRLIGKWCRCTWSMWRMERWLCCFVSISSESCYLLMSSFSRLSIPSLFLFMCLDWKLCRVGMWSGKGFMEACAYLIVTWSAIKK